MNIALLTAGGVGNRMGQDIPKQFMTIDNVPVIIYTMQAFQNHPLIDGICVVLISPSSNGYSRVVIAISILSAMDFGD